MIKKKIQEFGNSEKELAEIVDLLPKDTTGGNTKPNYLSL